MNSFSFPLSEKALFCLFTDGQFQSLSKSASNSLSAVLQASKGCVQGVAGFRTISFVLGVLRELKGIGSALSQPLRQQPLWLMLHPKSGGDDE